MVASRKLTTEEVDALIAGMGEDDAGPAPARSPSGVEVVPFAFGSDDLSLLGDYYALRMINERFCRFARAVFYLCCAFNRGFRRFHLKSKPLTNILVKWKIS